MPETTETFLPVTLSVEERITIILNAKVTVNNCFATTSEHIYAIKAEGRALGVGRLGSEQDANCFLMEKTGYSVSMINRFARAGKTMANLSACDSGTTRLLPDSEGVIRGLTITKLLKAPEKQRQAWDTALEDAGEGVMPSSDIVKKAVEKTLIPPPRSKEKLVRAKLTKYKVEDAVGCVEVTEPDVAWASPPHEEAVIQNTPEAPVTSEAAQNLIDLLEKDNASLESMCRMHVAIKAELQKEHVVALEEIEEEARQLEEFSANKGKATAEAWTKVADLERDLFRTARDADDIICQYEEMVSEMAARIAKLEAKPKRVKGLQDLDTVGGVVGNSLTLGEKAPPVSGRPAHYVTCAVCDETMAYQNQRIRASICRCDHCIQLSKQEVV